jgi:aminoglycoside phosphotransferase (APT) family kinase protein
VSALQRLAAASASRDFDEILSMRKLGEEASNRTFLIEFRDGFKLVARVPYPVTQPGQLIVASEIATMVYLCSYGIPVPHAYGYSATADNPTKTEYIFMGFRLGNNSARYGPTWTSMTGFALYKV